MTQAIFSLIGVVIGGLITTVQNYWLERRRERRRVPAAARLVRQEFVDGMSSAGQVHLFDRNLPVTRNIVLAEGAWPAQQATFAGVLRGSEWSNLMWASKHRREFMDWITEKRASDSAIIADDLTLMKVSNLYYWSNIGFDALNKAAGFSWRERRRIRRMRAEDLERQRAESDNAVAKR